MFVQGVLPTVIILVLSLELLDLSALLQHTLCIRPVYITQQGGVLHWYIGWYIGVGTRGRMAQYFTIKIIINIHTLAGMLRGIGR